MNNHKLYFILINTGMGYTSHYEIKGEKKDFRLLGAVISRHHTIQAALRARKAVIKEALSPIKTDIVRLHFWINPDDYVGEQYGGRNNFSYRPCSCLINQ